jgi:predicted nuclease of predicted toxin-antitoxin system
VATSHISVKLAFIPRLNKGSGDSRSPVLKKSGVDILLATEFSRGLSDRKLLEVARRKGRIIVTFDQDFGQLIFKEKLKSNGIILLRFIPLSPQQIAKRITDLLASKIAIENRVVTLLEDNIRVTLIK